jgi:hypothetical protein
MCHHPTVEPHRATPSLTTMRGADIEEELFVTKVLDGDDQPGKYRLRLYDAAASAWEEVTIDDRIPCDPKKAWFDAPTPLFAKNYGAEVCVIS